MAITSCLIVLGLATLTVAQEGICAWQETRGGVVQNSLYLEGGIRYTGTWRDGQWSNCEAKTAQAGSLYNLSFSTPFDIRTTNLSSLFVQIPETVDGSSPVFVDGTMITNDYEWYTFGGMAYYNVRAQNQAQGIAHQGLYQPAGLATDFARGPNVLYPITANITKYITHGAGASVPSESLGFYFSGFRSATNDRIGFANGGGTSADAPSTPVTTMMTVDTSVFGVANWTEIPLGFIAPRAGASMVWIPTSSRGALMVIGGVPRSIDLNGWSTNSTQAAANANQSPTFINNIPVYDIGTDSWYIQNTTGTLPPPFAQACTVVASASDGSSHQIYVYGGWSGNSATQVPYDDVWILSVPAFVWVRASTGNANHGRYAHYCAKPYPNQMFSVGGVSTMRSALKTQAIIDVFDLNTLNWTGTYDPTKWAEYKIPSIVTAIIGGNENGSSTMFAASMSSGLRNVFSTPYTKPIRTYYPYTSQNPTPPPKSSSSVAVKVAVPVVIVVVLLVTSVIAWCCFFSPKARKRRSEKISDDSTHRHHRSILNWVKGSSQFPPPPPKSVVSTDVTEIGEATSSRAEVPGSSYFAPRSPPPPAAEVDGTALYGRTMMYSPTSQATSPGSPGSHTSAELEAVARPTLQSQLHGNAQRNTEVFRNHPYYPPSIGVQSMPSPALSGRYANARAPIQSLSHGMAAHELPPTRSTEDVGGTLTPLDLNKSKSDGLAEGASSDMSGPSGASSDINALRTPDLVPSQPKSLTQPKAQPMPVASSKPPHHRTTSSTSSGMAITLSPFSVTTPAFVSPGEERRRSEHIASLPNPGDEAGVVERKQAESQAEITITDSQKSAYERNQQRLGGNMF